MNRYQPSTFRPAFGIAAAVMSAVTLAVLVVVPVSFATANTDERMLTNAPAAVEVAIVPAHIDVVATSVRVVKLEPVSVVARRSSQAS
ncbi:MAG: hypothetical protein ABI569_08990 [Casimicrobiaceae bacterium]